MAYQGKFMDVLQIQETLNAASRKGEDSRDKISRDQAKR